MPEPSKIPNAWAWNGDINTIPNLDPGNGFASWELGYPIETQTPIAAGGTPPRRQDMNGALNSLSKHALWYQRGGLWTYSALVDYEVGNHVLDSGSLYYCIAANGPSGTVKSPSADTAETYWKPIIFANGKHPDPDHLQNPAVLQVLQAVYPVGSIYCSYGSTSPAVLFGFGTWVKIEGRFLLGASSTYSLTSQGGAATVTLTVNQIPAHNHGASVSTAGWHTHGAGTSSAGAHTHSVSGYTGSDGNHSHTIYVNNGGDHSHSAGSNWTGDHTHTRGTMDITGALPDTHSIRAHTPGVYSTGAFNVLFNNERIPALNKGTVDRLYGFDFVASRSWTGATSSAGGHSHTITVNWGGAHSHSASSSTTGAHTHGIGGTAASAGAHTHSVTINGDGNHTHSTTVGNTGGSQAHDNMPPYLAVSMWRRTA